MKKIFTIVALVFFSLSARAQELASYIPSNAQVVATIKGKNFLDLLSVSEFNQSSAGKMLLEKISTITGNEYKDASELGIRLEANAYYFYEINDSISYHSLLIPLSNAEKFAHLLDRKNQSIQKKDKFNLLNDSTMTVIWDHEKAWVMVGNTRSIFFEDRDVATRYNLSSDIYSYDYLQEDIMEEPLDYSRDSIIDSEIEEIYEGTDVYEEEPDSVYYGEEYIEEEDYENTYEYDTAVIDDYSDDYSYDSPNYDYFNKTTVNDQKLDSIGSIWTLEHAEKRYAFPAKNSILSNQAYLKSLDPKAEASIWVMNPFYLYEVNNTFSSLSLKNNMFSMYSDVNAHIYFEDDHLRIVTNMKVEEEMAKSFKEIYNRKINRKFLKYVNSKKAVGYLGYAINTEAYFRNLPKIISNTYSPSMLAFGADDGAVDIFADLTSLFIDEKAIGELIKGDALVVLNGVSEKEVTYKDYEYDDDYNSEEVEKTKMESVPDFLFMASSDNTPLIKKLLDYGVSKEVITENKGIYRFNDPDDALDVYVLLKNGIVFLGSSYKDLFMIQKGTFRGYTSRSVRKMIRKNNFFTYLDSKKTLDAIPEKDRDMVFNNSPFLYQVKDLGGLYVKSDGIKGNTLSGELIIETSKEYKNAFKYLFSLFDAVVR